jgi:pimeloyl-ACP methyl ester carboxylesterase
MRQMLKAGRSIGSFSPDEIEMYEAIQREPDAVRASVRMYRTFLTQEMPQWALRRFVPGRLTVPTLWLVGEHDVLAKRSDDGYRDHADDMTLELVPGANHFMPEELPEQTADRMAEFLA